MSMCIAGHPSERISRSPSVRPLANPASGPIVLAVCAALFVLDANPAQAVEGICIKYCNGETSTDTDDDDDPQIDPTYRQTEPTEQDIRRQKANELDELGHQAANNGDFETAIQYFKQALSYWPDSPYIEDSLAWARNQLGVQAYERGDFATAATLFELAVGHFIKVENSEIARDNLAAARRELDLQQQAEAAARLRQTKLKEAQDKLSGILDRLDEKVTSGAYFEGSPEDVSAGASGLQFMPPTGTATATAAHLDPSVVDVRDLGPDRPATVDPLAIDDPASVALRQAQSEELRDSVKNLPPAKAGSDKDAVFAKEHAERTKVVLDALVVGNGDWMQGLEHLKEADRRFPNNMAVRDATNYFRGLVIGLNLKGQSAGNLSAASTAAWSGVLGNLLPLPVLGSQGVPGSRAAGQGQAAGLGFDSWSLIQQARALLDRDPPNYAGAINFYRQAREKAPEHLELRDEMNFIEGWYAAVNEETGTK